MSHNIILSHHITVLVQYSNPFSFEKTFYIPTHYRTGIELYLNHIYYIPFRLSKVLYGLKFYVGKDDSLMLDIYYENSINKTQIKQILNEIDYRFSLTKDYSEFYLKFQNDLFLGGILQRNYGKHISSIYSLYELLIISVFLQNTTVKRTIDMCSNMLNRFGKKIYFDNIELFALWLPDEIDTNEQELRNLKLGYRAKNIMRITEYFNKVNLLEENLRKLSTKELINELLLIYGVGKQTVFYLTLEQFHRTETLIHIPMWERRILSKYIFDKEIEEEERIINWLKNKYGVWCAFTLELIIEDIFFKHKNTPIGWLKTLMHEK